MLTGMSKVFAWIMAVLAIGMLLLQLAVAESPKMPVVAFWALVLVLCVYVLFFKKPKDKTGN